MYKRLKITIKLKSNPIINNDLYLDGLLYSLYYKRQLGNDCVNISRNGHRGDFNLSKVKIPIKREKGVYLCSKLNFKIVKEYITNWSKRWNELSADQWCELKRIYTNQKKHKNYRIPLKIKVLRNMECWFYCIGDIEELNNILSDMIGIGKEQGQGYGLVDSFKIEETNHKGVRVFPITFEKNLPKNEIVKFVSYKYPYASSKKVKCVYRKF